jgi:hypothetical protein
MLSSSVPVTARSGLGPLAGARGQSASRIERGRLFSLIHMGVPKWASCWSEIIIILQSVGPQGEQKSERCRDGGQEWKETRSWRVALVAGQRVAHQTPAVTCRSCRGVGCLVGCRVVVVPASSHVPCPPAKFQRVQQVVLLHPSLSFPFPFLSPHSPFTTG